MNKPLPPKWVARFISFYSSPHFSQEIVGDLQEMYEKWADERGLARAKILYVWNALLFLRRYNSRFSFNYSTFSKTTMIKQTLKISLRNIAKNKVYAIGNITGLAIGISICLMMLLHIGRELSYEQSYPKHERIFRISSNSEWAQSPPSFAKELADFFPEIQQTARFALYNRKTVVGNEEHQFISENVYQTDQSSIDVFDLQFLDGSSDGALDRPYTVLITEQLAKKLYSDESAVGQLLEINEGSRKFEITGVIKNLPQNSHLKAEVLISMATFYDQIPEEWTTNRGWMVMHTYVLLNSPESVASLNQRMRGFMDAYLQAPMVENMVSNGYFFEVMALTDIYLNSNKTGEMGANSDIAYVYIFITLACFIIVIASVNFINIFSTLTIKRVKEIGLRKIVGARRGQLVGHLLIESGVTALLAAVLGMGLCLLMLPYYNQLADLEISVAELLEPLHLLTLLGLSIVLGLISGLYPSFLVTKQNLVRSISSSTHPKASISLVRKGLIIFQFALSLFILISTVVVNKQMAFIQKKDLGFETDQLVTAKAYGNLGREVRKNRQSMFASLMENPNVKDVAMASNIMGEALSVEYFTPVDLDPEQDFGNTNMVWVDENYLETMGIELVKGRDFRSKADTAATFLVSEQLAEKWPGDAIGSMAEYRGEKGPIVGIFKDVHFYSLHSQVAPLVICYRPSWTSRLLFKIDGANPVETMAYIEAKLKEKSPNAIVQFSYATEKLQELYQAESKLFSAFRVFSIIALAISCLGLLGIAGIEVQRRTKEVGIRKVLGASAREVLFVLSKKFILMLLLAIALAIPLSFFSAENWLSEYGYRITLSSWDFIMPSLALIAISFLVITVHSLKVVQANPTESLRDE